MAYREYEEIQPHHRGSADRVADSRLIGGSAGGGGTSIAPRVPAQEKPTIRNWYGFNENQFFNLLDRYPVLGAANEGALGYYNQLGNLTDPLQGLYGQLGGAQGTINRLQSQFGDLPQNLQNQFGDLPQQLLQMSGSLQNQYGDLPQQLQMQFGNLPQDLMNLTQPLTDTASGYLSGILRDQGALSPEASRESLQNTYTQARNVLGADPGAARQLGTVAQGTLNRQAAREARYNAALGQYNAATGQVGILDQLAQGLGTQLAQTRQGLAGNLAQIRAGLAQGAQGLGTNLAQVGQGLGLGLAGGLQALQSGDIAQRTGLAGAIQNLQSGGLNQLLQTAQGSQNVFSGLTNPILSYLSNLFGGNLQARIAQAQINQQGNIASDNKTAGLVGGALSSLGSIAGGIAMSDERVKTKIRDTGTTTTEGVPLKTWEYKTRPGVRFLSPLAQDVEKKMPDRVLTDPVSGVKFMVGFPIIEVSKMKGAA